MRADFESEPSFSELLGQVRERALGAYSNQDLPYERLVEELAPPREASHNPVFQVMFALQNGAAGRLDLDGVSASQLEVENGTSKFDLTLDVYELGPDGLRLEFEYSSDLFEPGRSSAWPASSSACWPAWSAIRSRAIGRLELLSPEEAESERRWSHGDPAAPFERPCTRPWRTGPAGRRRRRPCAGTAAS